MKEVNIQKTLERIVEKLNNSTGISIDKDKFNKKVEEEKGKFLEEVCEFLGIEVVYVKYFLAYYMDLPKERIFKEGATETPFLTIKDEDKEHLYIGIYSNPIERKKLEKQENWIKVESVIEIEPGDNTYFYHNGEVWIENRMDVFEETQKKLQIKWDIFKPTSLDYKIVGTFFYSQNLSNRFFTSSLSSSLQITNNSWAVEPFDIIHFIPVAVK